MSCPQGIKHGLEGRREEKEEEEEEEEEEEQGVGHLDMNL
jgi:hypothetical protein